MCPPRKTLRSMIESLAFGDATNVNVFIRSDTFSTDASRNTPDHSSAQKRVALQHLFTGRIYAAIGRTDILKLLRVSYLTSALTMAASIRKGKAVDFPGNTIAIGTSTHSIATSPWASRVRLNETECQA
ncbi:hypothetical protein CGCTS75_v012401 [Colletotrichum tropicale]|nr:hypothetical protein CGCTS75_v012401 [Colletotrichum tropicale]